MPAVAFRFQNVYGPGQSLSNPYTGILSIFSNLIKSGQNINIFEDGRETRDFVFISDVVEATIAGIERECANQQVFNVGTGKQTTVLDVARTLIKHYGREVPMVVSGMYRLGDIRHNFADTTRLREVLKVTPKVEFDEGMRRFAEWVDAQSASGNGFERSLEEMRSRGLLRNSA